MKWIKNICKIKAYSYDKKPAKEHIIEYNEKTVLSQGVYAAY